MAEFLFWACVAVPLYAWLGYPLLLTLVAPLFPRQRPRACALPAQRVSVVIAAHNEQRHIVAKLRSVLGQDYAAAELQVMVASDGSTDATVALARSLGDSRVTVLDLPRLGKPGALNEAVLHCDGDLLVFTDADNRWADDTLGKLLAPFADPRVGASAGHLRIERTGSGLSPGDRLYRQYEAWVRSVEQRVGCMVSADGALLALRRALYQPIPAQVNDDFYISTCAPVAGMRIAYVADAVVLDVGVDEADKQFRRRQRVTVGGLSSLAARRELLAPWRHGLYAVALISHKLLRRLAPVMLLPLLLSNLFLLQAHDLYRWSLAMQLVGYGVALLGLLDTRRRLPKPFRVAAFALVTLAGMSLGLWHFLRGQRYLQWNPDQNR